jgi:hypothetical protein
MSAAAGHPAASITGASALSLRSAATNPGRRAASPAPGWSIAIQHRSPSRRRLRWGTVRVTGAPCRGRGRRHPAHGRTGCRVRLQVPPVPARDHQPREPRRGPRASSIGGTRGGITGPSMRSSPRGNASDACGGSSPLTARALATAARTANTRPSPRIASRAPRASPPGGRLRALRPRPDARPPRVSACPCPLPDRPIRR